MEDAKSLNRNRGQACQIDEAKEMRGFFLVFIFLIAFSISTTEVHAGWWNVSYGVCRNITVNNTQNTNSLQNYPFLINLTNVTNMQTNFSDIAFINNSCDEVGSLLPFYIQSNSSGSWVNSYVRIDNITNNSLINISVYYNSTPNQRSNETSACPGGYIEGSCLEALENFETSNGWYNTTDSLFGEALGLPDYCPASSGCGSASSVFAGTHSLDCGCPYWYSSNPIWAYKNFTLNSGIQVNFSIANGYRYEGRGDGPVNIVWGSDKTGATGNTLNSTAITGTFTYENATGNYSTTISGLLYLTVRVVAGDIGWSVDYMKVKKVTTVEPTYSVGDEIFGDNYDVASEYYVSPTYSGNVAPFNISIIAANTISNVEANLSWNYTNYTSSFSHIGLIWNFTKDITIPSVGQETNVTFQWFYKVSYVNGSYAFSNTTPKNQTIGNPLFCILNTTDEDNTSKTLTFDVEITTETYTNTTTGITTFCTNVPAGETGAKVSSSGYDPKYYYITIPEGGYNMTAYLLNSSVSDLVTFTVKNMADQVLEDAYMSFSRLYSDGWRNVSMSKTDSNGKIFIYMNPNASYKIKITKSNYESKTLTMITNGITEFTIYLTAGVTPRPGYWDYYKRLNGECSFSNTTRILTCSWSDSSGKLSEIRLKVTAQNKTTAWALCDNSSTASASYFYCDFGAPNNQTFFWSLEAFFNDPEPLQVDSGSWTDFVIGVVLGLTGLVIGLLIVLFSGFIGIQFGSPVMTVLMTMIGVGISVFMGFIGLGAAAITVLMGFFVAGGVLIWKMR